MPKGTLLAEQFRMIKARKGDLVLWYLGMLGREEMGSKDCERAASMTGLRCWLVMSMGREARRVTQAAASCFWVALSYSLRCVMPEVSW